MIEDRWLFLFFFDDENDDGHMNDIVDLFIVFLRQNQTKQNDICWWMMMMMIYLFIYLYECETKQTNNKNDKNTDQKMMNEWDWIWRD